MRYKFIVSSSGYGKTDFTFKGEHGKYVGIFWVSVGLTIASVFGYMILMMILAPIIGPMSTDPEIDPNAQLRGFLVAVPIFALYAAIGIFFQVRLQNYMWNTVELGGNKFRSTLSVTDMIYLYLTNLIGIVFSLGLLTPWAQIRMIRYRAEHMHVDIDTDWQKYVADEQSEGSALGDEVGEAFDVDVGLGF